MKKIVIAAAMVLTTTPLTAQNMTYYLVAQWVGDHGNRFCKYGNGTVLNVGVNVCPLSIKGW